jgi:hypothetical protein
MLRGDYCLTVTDEVVVTGIFLLRLLSWGNCRISLKQHILWQRSNRYFRIKIQAFDLPIRVYLMALFHLYRLVLCSVRLNGKTCEWCVGKDVEGGFSSQVDCRSKYM